MNETIPQEVRELINVVHYRPAVSIIMPIETKMNGKNELIQNLKFAVTRAEKEIKQNYPVSLALPVVNKLKHVIDNLNFANNKKSIAIYVSPVLEKVLYLDIPVDEKIIIDESFEIRDLVYANKESHNHLVLVLSGKTFQAYIGHSTSLVRIKSNIPATIAAYTNDGGERVANFSDPSARKEILTKKLLEQADKALSAALQSHRLPVIVLGTKKILGYFKELTKNDKNITGYVHGNYENAPVSELEKALKPHIEQWKRSKIKDLQLRLERAADAGRLTTGMKNVWKMVSQRKGRLLVVEKNFNYHAEYGSSEDLGDKVTGDVRRLAHVRDAVDDAIEKVLEFGGDVEFVDPGVLKLEDHIALIQYY